MRVFIFLAACLFSLQTLRAQTVIELPDVLPPVIPGAAAFAAIEEDPLPALVPAEELDVLQSRLIRMQEDLAALEHEQAETVVERSQLEEAIFDLQVQIDNLNAVSGVPPPVDTAYELSNEIDALRMQKDLLDDRLDVIAERQMALGLEMGEVQARMSTLRRQLGLYEPPPMELLSIPASAVEPVAPVVGYFESEAKVQPPPEAAPPARPIPGALVPSTVPVQSATNLFGVYTVGRGSQVFSWTQPLQPGTSTVDTNYTSYRLYWWTTGSSVTNTVDIPREAQQIMMSGIAGANKPLTFFNMTVVNDGLESPGSNLLLVPSEP